MNSLASEYLGRDYLLQRKSIVHSLVETLYLEGNKDSYLRQNALGALQKFSLRRQAQSQMIGCNVIRWIMQILSSSPDNLSDYTFEYATALLMNLSLRNKGKDACEKLAPEINIIRELSEMMEHPNVQVRTHVNGTLYSILTRKILKQQAEAIGMQEILTYLMQNPDEQLQRQIQYIEN